MTGMRDPTKPARRRAAPIRLRYLQIKDARRLYEILNCPDVVYFSAAPATIAEEERYIRRCQERQRQNLEHTFAIVRAGEVVGAVGLKLDPFRSHVGEIGYFVDRRLWGRGIAPRAVALAEDMAVRRMELRRIELLTLPGNEASIRVAQKCGYRREGIQRAKLLHEGRYCDAVSFAKVMRRD